MFRGGPAKMVKIDAKPFVHLFMQRKEFIANFFWRNSLFKNVYN